MPNSVAPTNAAADAADADRQPSRLAVGDTFLGKYEIRRVLGRGAMGVVYEAADRFIGRRVAIKTISFDAAASPAVMAERFAREARAAGRLMHRS
ncbi:MAG: hypothetical protein HYV63_24065 [Candidatus Schekmanbacteria bacterium]|nr:hypothetical protein [Candidatus Schekmanbacteria bacterium]